MPDPGTQFHDSSFWLIRLTGRPFVDKSGFIEELLSRPPARITRITRPAGFGKTVNLNMLRDFLDIRMDNSRFFDGLRVLQNAGLCKKWMHRYPVIWLPLELLHEQGPDPVFHSFRRIASDLVIDHSYLLESPGVDRFHRLRLASICDMLASKVRLASTLRYLVRALSDHWGRKVVLLVDDADKPFACAESEGYRHALTSFLRELFAGALEENGLAFAVLAGSLGFDCPERSMFCSHGEENCGIRDEGFESCFGFTQAEVADLLAGAGLAGREADLGAWCGGYHVGRESCLHNAREVMFSLHVLGQQADAEPETGPGADLGTEPCAGIDAATGTGRSAGPDTGSGTGAGTESRAALTPLCHPDWRNRAMRRALAAALAGRNSREKISDYLEKLLAGGETGFRFHGLTWKEAAGSRGSLFGALLHCGWLGQSREPARWGPKEAVYVTVPNGAARRELAAMLREVRAEPAAKGREEALCPAGQGCKWPDSSPDTSPDTSPDDGPDSRSDFRKIRERGLPFADKSGFIEEMLDGHPYPATLLLRPTGFGRTVNLTMLRDFLDIRQDSRALFEGLAVSRNTGLCQRWMNRYPVIYLSLKEMRGLTFGEAAAAFRRLVADLCREHDYLESSPRLAGYDKSPLAPLLDPKADSVFMEFGLKHLTSLLREHWGRDAVVLLDDCDAPLACAVRNGYAEAMLSFLRGLAGTTLIGNSALEFGVFAGCLNVLRGSFNDDLYKIRVRGIGDSFLDRCFGFTEAEVADLLARTGLGGCRETIREWCGGHHAGRVPNLYCPRDVMTGIAALRWEPDPVTGRVAADEAGPWAELAEYLSDWGRLERACLHAMETALEPDRGCLAGILERLLAGGTVELGFDPYLAWDRAGGSGDKLLSLLVHCGWLAADGGTEETGCFGRNARAVLPNRMARELLSRAVRVMNIWRLGQLPKAELLDALENGDSKGFTSALEGLLSESILPRDAGEGSPAYLTLLVELFRIFVCPVWVAGGPDARPDDRAGGETGGADLLVKPCRTFNRIRLRVSASPAALKADAREALRSLKLCAGASPGARPGEEEEDFQDEAHARLWGLAFCGRRCLAVTRTL